MKFKKMMIVFITFCTCSVVISSSSSALFNRVNGKNITFNQEILSANNPPYPPIISGPTNGKLEKTYEYIFTLTDPNEDDFLIVLEVDFGNEIKQAIKKNCELPWFNGTNVSLTNKWSMTGPYDIKARVMDSFGEWSDWSDPLVVRISKQKIDISRLYTFLIFNFLPM